MKIRIKSAVAGAAALAIAGGLLVASGGAASAATTPTWEPDPNSRGAVVFYDASGNVLTGGTNLGHIADYMAASTAGDAGATKATAYFANPTPNVATGAWPANSASTSTFYPNSAAPAPIGSGFNNPLVSLGATDGNLTAFSSGHTVNTATGYVDMYQVRVFDSGGTYGSQGSTYWESDIQITRDSAGNATGWTVVYPAVTTTTTTLTASPASPQVTPSTVTLTATVAPASNGTVQFFDGATSLGSAAVTTANGTATQSVSSPAVGSHPYKAVFTPTGGTTVQGSNGALTYQVNAPAKPTATTLSVNQDGYAGDPVTFTADVTDTSVTPAAPLSAGTVSFYDNGSTTPLGTASVSSTTPGQYVYTMPSGFAGAGSHSVVATFNPTNPAAYNSSSSPAATFTQQGPKCTTCRADATVTTTVDAGSLSITTPYTPTSPFNLGHMVLDPNGTVLRASAPFGSSISPTGGVTITDTRAGNISWTASAQTTDFSTGGTSPALINGENLGLTGITPAYITGNALQAGSVTTTDVAPDATVVGPADTGSNGLKGVPHTIAHANNGDGTVYIDGTLKLNAPTSTTAGVYTATLTFTIA